MICCHLNTFPMKRASLLLFAAAVTLMTSCNSKTIFDHTKTIPDGVWNEYNKLVFEVPVEDTLNTYDFYLNLRHSVDYRYANIYFFIRSEFPGGRKAVDTLDCILADKQGKWYGKGLSDVKDNQILLRRGLRFPEKGTYTFTIEQAMREKDLKGIKDVGIRIIKAEH